jgi:hypothetical protein
MAINGRRELGAQLGFSLAHAGEPILGPGPGYGLLAELMKPGGMQLALAWAACSLKGRLDEAATAPAHCVCARGLRCEMGLRAEIEGDEFFSQKQFLICI